MLRTVNLNRFLAGGKKPPAVPMVEIGVRARPNGAVGVRVNVLDVAFGNPLLLAILLKAGTEKPVDAVLRGHPQKSGAIRRQCIDRQVLEPFGLPVGAKDILLRLKAS